MLCLLPVFVYKTNSYFFKWLMSIIQIQIIHTEKEITSSQTKHPQCNTVSSFDEHHSGCFCRIIYMFRRMGEMVP